MPGLPSTTYKVVCDDDVTRRRHIHIPWGEDRGTCCWPAILHNRWCCTAHAVIKQLIRTPWSSNNGRPFFFSIEKPRATGVQPRALPTPAATHANSPSAPAIHSPSAPAVLSPSAPAVHTQRLTPPFKLLAQSESVTPVTLLVHTGEKAPSTTPTTCSGQGMQQFAAHSGMPRCRHASLFGSRRCKPSRLPAAAAHPLKSLRSHVEQRHKAAVVSDVAAGGSRQIQKREHGGWVRPGLAGSCASAAVTSQL